MRQLLKRRGLIHLLLAIIFAAPFVWLLSVVPNKGEGFSSKVRIWFDSLEYTTVDLRMQFGRKAEADPRLVLLAVDDESFSLDALDPGMVAESKPLSLMRTANGSMRFPRTVYAYALDRLTREGADAVAFDFMFPQPAPDDGEFARSLGQHIDKVVVGYPFGAETNTLNLPTSTLLPSQDPLDPRLGYLSFYPDTDNVLRCALYRNNVENLHGIHDADQQPKFFSLSARVGQRAGVDVPDSLLPRPIRFMAPEHFPRFSFYEIFDPHSWDHNFQGGRYFKNKLVFIGPVGAWSKDYISTPVGDVPGVEAHINAVNALLKHEFLVPSSNTFSILAVIVAAIGTLLLAMGIASIVWRFGAAVAILFGYASLAFVFYNGPGWLLPVVAPMGVFCGALGSGFVYDFALAQFERLRLRMTFERYHSKNVVKYLLDNTESYKNMLAGTRRPVTVLFSDIRGFTTIVEATAESHELVHKLNEYLTAMVECVFLQDGSIGKFMGDGIMAVWGDTPYSSAEKLNAARAVRAALGMIAALRRLNAKWVSEGKPEWHIGIGLNHGPAIVGDFGSQEHRKEFDVLGDAINLGSRLEGLTKEYRLEILLGESVAELVRESFYLRTVDLVQVKGKLQAVQTFTVLGEKTTSLPEKEQKFLTAYEEGVAAFRARDFARACERLREAVKLAPEDFLAGDYLASAEEFRTKPPGKEWTGVRVMTRK